MRISDWSSDVCSSDLPGPCRPREWAATLYRPMFRLPPLRPANPVSPMPFSDLPPVLVQALTERGYAAPTPVQAAVLTPEAPGRDLVVRSAEHTSELQSLMRISYAVFCLQKKPSTPHNNQVHIKHE